MTDSEFRIINCQELVSFTQSSLFSNAEVIPITKHRAKSMASNPDASPDDPAVVLALKNNRIIGYVCLLAGNAGGNKIFWNSGWWVAPGENQIALLLLLKALKISGERMLLTDMTSHTYDIISNLHLYSFINKGTYYRFFIRIYLSDFVGILKPVDTIINSIKSIRDRMKYKVPEILSVEFPAKIDQETDNFIQEHNKQDLSAKDRMFFNWIVKHPWILPAGKDEANEKMRYYFSSFEDGFRQLPIVFREKGGQICGFAMTSIRKKNLKINYVYANNFEIIAQWFLGFCLEQKINSVICAHVELNRYFLKKRPLFIHVKEKEMALGLPRKINHDNLASFSMQLGEGDVVFT